MLRGFPGYGVKSEDYSKRDANTGAGLVEIQGKRSNQEDQLQVTVLEDVAQLSPNRFDTAINDTFAKMQEHHGGMGSTGSTAMFATAWIDENGLLQAKSAHVGDSEAYVIVVDGSGIIGKPIRLNKLHNPTAENPGEVARITGTSRNVIFGRVGGQLAVSRAIGDTFILTHASDHEPEIDVFQAVRLQDGQRAFLVVNCDGLTEKDSMTAENIARIVQQNQNDTLNAAVELTKAAYDSGSGDNISVAVVPILPGKPPVSAAVFDGHGGTQVALALAHGKQYYIEGQGNVLCDGFYTELKKQIQIQKQLRTSVEQEPSQPQAAQPQAAQPQAAQPQAAQPQARLYTPDDHINEFLSKLQENVSSSEWNKRGQGFFSLKTPNVIEKLRLYFKSESKKSPKERLIEVTSMMITCEHRFSLSRLFRKKETSEFYKKNIEAALGLLGHANEKDFTNQKTPDEEKANMLSEVLTILEERANIRHGQGSPAPKAQVGIYKDGSVDIRTRWDKLVRKILNEQNIKFVQRRASTSRNVTHFTMHPDQAEKFFRHIAEVVEQNQFKRTRTI